MAGAGKTLCPGLGGESECCRQQTGEGSRKKYATRQRWQTCRDFKNQRNSGTGHGHCSNLDGGQPEGRDPRRVAGDQQNLDCYTNSADKDEKITETDGQIVVQTEQSQPNCRQNHAHNHRRTSPLAQKERRAHRHKNHIHPGDEAGFGWGGVEQAEGLKAVAGPQHQTNDDGREQNSPLCLGIFVVLSCPRSHPPPDENRRKGKRSNCESKGQESKDRPLPHRILHHHKSRAPQCHHQQERQIGDKLSANHSHPPVTRTVSPPESQ